MNFDEELLELDDINEEDISHNLNRKIILNTWIDVQGTDIVSRLNQLIMRIVNIEKMLSHIDSLETSSIDSINEKITKCKNTLVGISDIIAKIRV